MRRCGWLPLTNPPTHQQPPDAAPEIRSHPPTRPLNNTTQNNKTNNHAGGKLYRLGDVKDKEMDELLTKRPPSADGEEENDLWIVSTPNPYEWAFGDTVRALFGGA